jgi:hypothetical protein
MTRVRLQRPELTQPEWLYGAAQYASGVLHMIGPAEIEDMLADYTEALAKGVAEKHGETVHWPVTQVQAPSPGSTLACLETALRVGNVAHQTKLNFRETRNLGLAQQIPQ